MVLSSSTELLFPQTIWGKGQVFLISIVSWTIIFVSDNQKLARKSGKKNIKIYKPQFLFRVYKKNFVNLFLFSFPFKISNFISVMDQ